MKKKKIVVACILLYVFAIFTGCGTKKIDVMESLTLNYSGVNGYGIAEIEDIYAWESSALEAAGIQDIDSFSDLEDAFVIESAVSYDISPKENLSNGDEVIVTAQINNEAVEKYKIKFEAKEKKFVVEGLPEVQTIDLFENIDVTFQGIAPDATAAITDANTDYFVYTQYALDKKNNLNIGDIVTVTAKYNKEELLSAGYVAENDTKEFMVSSIPKYVTELSEIPDDILGKMKKQIEDAMLAQVASKWAEKESLSEMNYVGSYLLKLKNGMYGDKSNYLYIIYKIDVENSTDTFSFYTYGCFGNLIILEDGTCSVDLSSYQTPSGVALFGTVSGEAFRKGDYYYFGYEDIESLFNNCVTANIENYEYESNVTE